MLALLAPTSRSRSDNALAYQRLADYQHGLERLVEERTAELRQARDALSGTVDQLREAQGARERIFANISHEIRTPLSLILLAVADVQARAGAHLDSVARDDLESVVEGARKLLRLVDELCVAAGQRPTQGVAPGHRSRRDARRECDLVPPRRGLRADPRRPPASVLQLWSIPCRSSGFLTNLCPTR